MWSGAQGDRGGAIGCPGCRAQQSQDAQEAGGRGQAVTLAPALSLPTFAVCQTTRPRHTPRSST